MSERKEVAIQTTIDGEIYKATFTHTFPSSLQEATSMYPSVTDEDGETLDPVYEEFMKGYVITVQNAARNRLKALDTSLDDSERSAQVNAFMQNWQYGQRAERKARAAADPVDAIAKKFAVGTAEEQQAILAMLAEKLGLQIPSETNGGDESEYSPRRARSTR